MVILNGVGHIELMHNFNIDLITCPLLCVA